MNRLKNILILIILSFTCYSAQAGSTTSNRHDTVASCDTCPNADDLTPVFLSGNEELAIINTYDTVKSSNFKTKKIIAAILSFPVPFGLLGLHRIFLGTKPYIPFVYMGTLGGCFLVLPLIDFITILSANEETFKQYENNPKVFMWSH